MYSIATASLVAGLAALPNGANAWGTLGHATVAWVHSYLVVTRLIG